MEDESSINDDAAAAQVAADIGAAYRRETVTDEQRLIWQLEFEAREEERRYRVLESRAKHQQEQAEAAEQVRLDAIAADRVERQRIQREIGERLDRERRDRELVGLRIKSAQHEAWQASVDQAARNAVAYKQNLTLMSELDKMINPEPPPPEPQTVYVEQSTEGSPDFGSDFNPALFNKKSRSW